MRWRQESQGNQRIERITSGGVCTLVIFFHVLFDSAFETRVSVTKATCTGDLCCQEPKSTGPFLKRWQASCKATV